MDMPAVSNERKQLYRTACNPEELQLLMLTKDGFELYWKTESVAVCTKLFALHRIPTIIDTKHQLRLYI